VRCAVCGTDNEAGRKFCLECGSPLARPCPSCSSLNAPQAKFCGECGSALAGMPDQDSRATIAQAAPAATAERRLVTVLFADLVGFTTLSESRDAEDVRDLLTRYFDTSSRIVERYGGTVEKFIGDAVMAVWGTPTANEDDAERAVRAALDLTAAVAALGGEVGAKDLRARAGLLTGEAAVTLGAKGQGMVAGDLVNTASRIQSAADAGTVLVGETTKHATDEAVVYTDAGLHEMKGKAEPVHLYRAERVVGLTKGALKSTGLEAPFVGREREFALVKEQFHSTADRKKAHLVSVWGIAGIGKSRLSWEFFKYIDGLAGDAWWHRGRCLPYGDGVTYWALAEMVRGRAGIAEGEDPATAAQKLRATVMEQVSDEEERQWIEPRLAHLLGLEDRSTRQPEELFSAWRLFFERLAATDPVVMVFEDLQWADAALLDFIEYLLEWSRNHPLFVMTLARPELADKHPNWGAGKRNLTSLALEPLTAEAMHQLLDGLAPGLPAEVRDKILDRAEGVPLYAVETVRMLVARGLLERDEATGAYRPAGPIEALAVPETLHALIAARLDGLTPEERALVQRAAVLGKTFTRAALADLSGSTPADVQALLDGLQRKEIVALQSDPRSPERGQYGFLQDLVKRVAYETLSRRDRKGLHMAAAHHLAREWTGEDDDVIEIVAHHFTQAYEAAPDAPDAADIKAHARTALLHAGERAKALAANADAQAYFDRAFALADTDEDRATLSERAGEAAMAAGRRDDARARFERAIDLFSRTSRPHAAARVTGKLGELLWLQFSNLAEAVELMRSAVDLLGADEEPDEDVAILLAQAGRLFYFQGELDIGMRLVERALKAAEERRYPWVLSQTLNTKGAILRSYGRLEEPMALLKHALAIAEEHDLPDARLRALFNLADDELHRDRYANALAYDLANLELAERMGLRNDIVMANVHLVFDNWLLGRWDEVRRLRQETPLPERVQDDPAIGLLHAAGAVPAVEQGSIEEAADLIELYRTIHDPTEVQDRVFMGIASGTVLRGQGRLAEALEAFKYAIECRTALGVTRVGRGLVEAVDIAIDLGRDDLVEELLGIVGASQPSDVPSSLEGEVLRIRGRLAARAGDAEAADALFRQARGVLREIENPFRLAVGDLEHAEMLVGAGRSDEALGLLAEAREIFERLGARPWLDRTDRAEGVLGSVEAVTT
jgi:class 3 adenylate cyclase/tetratricopeptide (TPR) repeat protein